MNQLVQPSQVRNLSPIEALREATKWIVGPVAQTLTGRPWKRLRRRLLAQASKLPHQTYLDTALMTQAAAEMSRLTWEIRILLEAHRLEPGSSQMAGIRRRAGLVAAYLLQIYRLDATQAPQLAKLAAGRLSIFVSYSREDWPEYVEPLVNRLRQAGFGVWVDQYLIRGGQDWLDEINQALESSDCLVLCVSPAALESKYVKIEYRYFLTEDKPILPLMCRPAKLPAELRPLQYIPYAQLDTLIARLREL